MYSPAHFREERPEALAGLVRDHPLGTLVVAGPDGLSAEHLPFLFDGKVLRAHVARANPVWKCAGARVLVVFQAPGGYVSPSLYDEKAQTGKVVPTYNYAAVHAHGVMRAISDPAWLLQLMNELSDRHEAGRAQPWTVADAPADFIGKLLGAIVGIEIAVDQLQGKWKVSQNHSAANRARVAGQVPGMRALMAGLTP
jgi:transcriptional regulator